MDRVIKFIIWDKSRNAWHRDKKEAVHILGENIVMQYILMRPDDSYVPLEKINNLVPLQFTGLTDKNGVEIYEGDIVEKSYFDFHKTVESKHIAEIRWNKWCWSLFGKLGFFSSADGATINDVTVIGNIHEHGYLLTEGK